MRRALTLCAAGTLGALLPQNARAGDFMDTTLTFVAGDDNVFAGAGETTPSSPRADLRPRTGNSLFFENYNTRNTGEETRGALVLSKEFTGHFTRVVPEASLVLQWDANRTARDIEQYGATGNRKPLGGLRDDGSFLAVHFDGEKDAAQPDVKPSLLSVVLFPFDADRLRLGYSWDLTWGGRASFLLAQAAPGGMVSWRGPSSYAFVGGKTARTQRFTQSVLDPQKDENEAIYGALAGGGVHLRPELLVEAGVGFFERGTIPLDRLELQGTWINQFGGSAQVTWHEGIEPRVPVDTKLLRNTGTGALKARDWKPRTFGWLVSAEATAASQQLENSDALGQPKREVAWAGDLNGLMQRGRWTLSVDVVLRSVEFLVMDTPGASPYATVSNALKASPEVFADVGADYTFPEQRFVPGLALGVQSPATAQVSVRTADGRTVSAYQVFQKTKNVLGETQVLNYTLPAGESAAPVLGAKLYLRQYLSDLMLVMAQAQLSYDNNRIANDPSSGARKFENPMVLGVNLLAQARF